MVRRPGWLTHEQRGATSCCLCLCALRIPSSVLFHFLPFGLRLSYCICCISSWLVLLGRASCQSRLRLLLRCMAVLRRRVGRFSCAGCQPAGFHHLPDPPVVLSPVQHDTAMAKCCHM